MPIDFNNFLFIPALQNGLEGVQRWIERSPDLDFKDMYGKTPLHISSQSGKLKIIELLLKHGANIESRDGEYKTPLHIAIIRELPIIISPILRPTPLHHGQRI